MTNLQKLSDLLAELSVELGDHILPFWMNRTIDDHNGGFVGALDNEIELRDAEKSGILNTRILWTFSAAARTLGDKSYLDVADRAMDYINSYFIDAQHHGVYWSLNSDGSVLDDRKHVYTQAFGIYALSEYYLASSDNNALELAKDLFQHVDAHAHQNNGTGYHEAFSRDWKPLADSRLGDNDIEADRTFNTHLHLLEAYTNLFRAWPDDTLRQRLSELVTIHLNRMYDPGKKHILAYFDDHLNPVSPIYSYGHDIEAAWLLYDAAVELEDDTLTGTCHTLVLDLADQTISEGCDSVNGGIFNLGQNGKPVDTDKQWWAQAEALSGFLYAYLLSGNEEYIDTSWQIWDFTKKHVIDRKFGEWYFMVDAAGNPDKSEFKVGPWKCPYHTSRTGLLFAALASGKNGNTPFSIFRMLDKIVAPLPDITSD